MIFQKRQDRLATVTAQPLEAVITREITREFPIESIFIRLSGTVTTKIKTATAETLLSLLSRVRLTVSDGARTRTPVDLSGAALVELCQLWTGFLGRNAAASIDAGTNGGAFEIVYPIFFGLPNVSDPIKSALMLPAPRYNSNPVLEITLAKQSDIDSGGDLAIAAGINVDVQVNRRVVTNVKFPFFDTELAEIEQAYASTGRQRYELQLPGSYTMLALRMFTSATTRGDITAAGGVCSLELLNVLIRRFTPADLVAENDLSQSNAIKFDGLAALDFVTDGMNDASELGSVFDVNVGAGSGSRAALVWDVTGGAGVKCRYLTHRIFGDIASLKAPVSR